MGRGGAQRRAFENAKKCDKNFNDLNIVVVKGNFGTHYIIH